GGRRGGHRHRGRGRWGRGAERVAHADHDGVVEVVAQLYVIIVAEIVGAIANAHESVLGGDRQARDRGDRERCAENRLVREGALGLAPGRIPHTEFFVDQLVTDARTDIRYEHRRDGGEIVQHGRHWPELLL